MPTDLPDMLVLGSTVTTGTGLTTRHGADITSDNWNSAGWWTNGFNWNGGSFWDESVWDFADGRLPILRGFKGVQNPVVVE